MKVFQIVLILLSTTVFLLEGGFNEGLGNKSIIEAWEEQLEKEENEFYRRDEIYTFVTFDLEVNNESKGEFTVDFSEDIDDPVFKLGDYTVEIVELYPTYELGEDRKPTSVSDYPFYPGFVMVVTDGPNETHVFVTAEKSITATNDSQIDITLVDYERYKVE